MNPPPISTGHGRSRARLLAGSLAWALVAQYFVVEALAQLAWTGSPYSMRYNLISDLGATICGQMPVLGTVVCSPLHPLMNASFMLTGIVTILGALLLRSVFPPGRSVTLSLLLIFLSSLGTIAVGLFPENEQPVAHVIGAATSILFGNLGLVILGLRLRRAAWPRWFALGTLAFGSIGLLGLLLLPLGLLPPVGVGLMERIAAYPLTLWVALCGLYFLRRTGWGRGGRSADPDPTDASSS
jgi:hypothetical membrane protein